MLLIWFLVISCSGLFGDIYGYNGEGYFNGTAYALLNKYINIKNHTSFSFKTCLGGVLLYQKKGEESVKIELDSMNGNLTFFWKTRSTTSWRNITIGSGLNNNVWQVVNLRYQLGEVILTAGNYEAVIAEEDGLNSDLIMLDLTNGGPLIIGAESVISVNKFIGCIREGPTVLLTSSLLHYNVLWGQCPLNSQATCGPLCQHPNHHLDCQNGGFCTEDDIHNATLCLCPTGYGGTLCEISEVNYCATRPCLNDGICYNNTYHDGYVCICQAGFAGGQCEIDIYECYSDPCQNGGVCLDGVFSYTCDCTDTGYEGEHCEVDIDECLHDQPCQNGGLCFNRYGAYTCSCMPGFGGENCVQNLNECDSVPCQNGGTCFQSQDFYHCACLAGFEGINCQINTDDCTTDSCQPPFECVDGTNGFTCECPSGQQAYDGGCIDIDECAPTPCLNGATCINLNDGFQCDCVDGYEGATCEQEVNECASHPCLFGECIDDFNSYSCQCHDGYAGTQCQTDIDECTPNPCSNNATCNDQVNGFHCTCQPGYTGQTCLSDVNECESSPCQNNADCVDHVNHYTCTCQAGYEGVNCEINTDECASNPCANEAVCVDRTYDYTCTCTAQWMGKNCDIPYDACLDLTPCQNGGTCQSNPPELTYVCTCPSGIEGTNCQTNIDDCLNVDCPNTGEVCVDLVDSYSCQCPEGYTGDGCTIDINECSSSPCLNGTCIDHVASYSCNCFPGSSGVNCDIETDECASNPCKNRALCTDLFNGYQCYCLPGFQGDNCDNDINECLSDPCQNGGLCIHDVGKYSCDCAPGYSGVHCEIDINECLSDPCRNGATCLDQINMYKCTCVAGYTGVDCEMEIDECDSSPCLNDGVCLNYINRFDCDCTDTGFDGVFCDHNIDDCVNVFCQNGGTCHDEVKGYNCACFEGYAGQDCDIDIDECESGPCLNGGQCLQRSNRTLYDTGYFDDAFSYDTASGFVCVCESGFEGTFCQVDIDECDSGPCVNSGTCEDFVNGYVCHCTAGWEGPICAHEIDECQSNPCQHGTCTDNFNMYECVCDAGYAGRNCDIALIGCDNGPQCQNGATCVPYLQNEDPNVHNYTCDCQPGFSGFYCTEPTDATFDGTGNMTDTMTNNQLVIFLRLTFRTTVPSGVLLYNGDSTFFSLELYKGQLYLRFGSSDSSIEYRETPALGSDLNDGNWHTTEIIISEYTMRIFENFNSQQVAIPPNRDVFQWTYIGAVDDLDHLQRSKSGQNFVGCMRDIWNEETKQFLLPQEQPDTVISGCNRVAQCDPDPCSGSGDCIDEWLHYTCVCHFGKTGKNCNYNVTAATLSYEDTTSYMHFTIDPASQGDQHLVQLGFRTTKPDGLIYFMPSTDQSQYVVVQLADGELKALVKSGTISNTVTVLGQFDDGMWHSVELAWREEAVNSILTVQVDELLQEQTSVVGNAAVNFSDIYIGGVADFSSISSVPSVSKEYFKGSVIDVRHNGYYLDAFPLSVDDLPPSYELSDDRSLIEGSVSDNMCDEDNQCQHNGTCETTWNDYICTCTYGFRGKNCDLLAFCSYRTCPYDAACVDRDDGFDCVTSATFDGMNAMVRYTNSISESAVIDDIKIKLRTRRNIGLILHASKDQSNEYVTIEMSNNDLVFKFNLGSVTGDLRHSLDAVIDGNWHVVKVSISNDGACLIIDDNINDRSCSLRNIAQSFSSLFTDASSSVYLASSDFIVVQGFKGCLEEVRIGGYLLPFLDRETLNSTSLEQFYATLTDVAIGCHGDPVCTSSPCQNGGSCEDIWNAYDCDCDLGYDGIHCENDIDECASTPCWGPSTCVDAVNGYTCVCAPGYTGILCDMDINECDSDPCQNNGTCENLENHFVCNCNENYTGNHCEYLIPKFTNCDEEPCQHDADCVYVTAADPSQPSFECRCKPGYEGVYCQDEIDYCANSMCKNGATCASYTNIQTFECQCVLGYTGRLCETNINECAGVYCQNGATCRDEINDFTCVCRNGYTGLYCQTDINECENNECVNGATCVDKIGEYECECPVYYTGMHCELDIDECATDTCLNGATCINSFGNFSCTCAQGYYGKTCDKNPCLVYPCENDAICRSANNEGTDLYVIVRLAMKAGLVE
ncbi:uncharacterized protein LOC100375718 [Saccoglossus kowalevskii]